MPLQKYTNAIRQLAYGGPADHYDEYLQVSETTWYECLRHFCRGVIEVFGAHYLRRPTVDDCQRLMEMHEQRHDFPGMLGSFDWSNNDINVLNQSPLFNDVLQGQAPSIPFTVNGTQYDHGYYLTDDIYPEWATFVKSFQHPQDPKRRKFKKMQEAARKDVERAFGVLQPPSPLLPSSPALSTLTPPPSFDSLFSLPELPFPSLSTPHVLLPPHSQLLFLHHRCPTDPLLQFA
ncbi:uncharacterized protein LOC131004131 [Salvia miltiorrhiza]|uniref:uncharacterized protein LOC131004131 n=1 Tax=Salvia miltiorrhiza TaxID=226208 RepID=UPI0025AC2B3D|nr:uncharacterized protein LOC131004131 [Salvia miltiorrhiza]